jgi:hypothetical protein
LNIEITKGLKTRYLSWILQKMVKKCGKCGRNIPWYESTIPRKKYGKICMDCFHGRKPEKSNIKEKGWFDKLSNRGFLLLILSSYFWYGGNYFFCFVSLITAFIMIGVGLSRGEY